MFGFQGDEAAETIARKKGYMAEAQKKWEFLTNYDMSTIKTTGQLSNMVKTRASISIEEAKRQVDEWCVGKQF